MNENEHSEYTTGRDGDNLRLPNGRRRPRTAQERVRAIRRASMRDQPLPRDLRDKPKRG